jgi:hypothetical protein
MSSEKAAILSSIRALGSRQVHTTELIEKAGFPIFYFSGFQNGNN